LPDPVKLLQIPGTPTHPTGDALTGNLSRRSRRLHHTVQTLEERGGQQRYASAPAARLRLDLEGGERCNTDDHAGRLVVGVKVVCNPTQGSAIERPALHSTGTIRPPRGIRKSISSPEGVFFHPHRGSPSLAISIAT